MAHPLRGITVPRRSVETQAIECSICIEKLVLDAIFYTPCGHTYHKHCIRLWLKSHITCPQCRQELYESRIRCVRFRPSPDNYEPIKLNQLQTQTKLLELDAQVNDMKIKVQKPENERLTSSVNLIKKEIATVKERLTAFKSLHEIVSNSRQDENIPDTNNPMALIRHIRLQKSDMEFSILLEHNDQQTMSDMLRLEHITTRYLNGVLKRCNERYQLQKKDIKELEEKLSSIQPITSTAIEATVKPKGVKTAKKLQVDAKNVSPNDPIATRTRSRLRIAN